MVGDFIIWFKRVWKQQVTCRHEYKLKGSKILCNFHTWYECDKCDKTAKH